MWCVGEDALDLFKGKSLPLTSVESRCVQIPRGLGMKSTWLGLGNHHALGLNKYVSYLS